MAEKNTAVAAAAEPVDRANDPAIVAWAEGKGARVLGGVDAGLIEAYDEEQAYLAALSRN